MRALKCTVESRHSKSSDPDKQNPQIHRCIERSSYASQVYASLGFSVLSAWLLLAKIRSKGTHEGGFGEQDEASAGQLMKVRPTCVTSGQFPNVDDI